MNMRTWSKLCKMIGGIAKSQQDQDVISQSRKQGTKHKGVQNREMEGVIKLTTSIHLQAMTCPLAYQSSSAANPLHLQDALGYNVETLTAKLC